MEINKKAVILFHGYVTDETDFKPLVPYLEKEYDCVVLKNFPGHGKENNITDFNSIDTIKQADRIVEETFKNYQTVDVIGFSMGGAIASYLATIHPFRKVILLAPANRYINLSLGISRLKLEIEYLRSLLTKKKTHQEEELIHLRKEVTINDKKSLDIAVKQLIPNYTVKTLQAFSQVIDYCNFHLEKGKITMPTLIIWGDVDQLVPYKSAKYVSKFCDDVTVEKMTGISHLMLYSDNNEIIIDRILEFIK